MKKKTKFLIKAITVWILSLLLIAFVFGLLAISAGAQDIKRSEWISVNDSLPSKNDKYLVYIRRCDTKHDNQCTEFIQAVFYDKPEGTYGKHWLTWYMQFDEYTKYSVKVTHWMPLPDPPEQLK